MCKDLRLLEDMREELRKSVVSDEDYDAATDVSNDGPHSLNERDLWETRFYFFNGRLVRYLPY